MRCFGKLGIDQVQATAETVDLGPAHPPKEDAVSAFEQILPELKKNLIHLRHEYSSELMSFVVGTTL